MTGKYRATLTGHTDKIREVVFSPDSTILASGGIDGIYLWDVTTGKHLRNFVRPQPFTGGADSLAFNPDGRILASSDFDGIHLWDVATGKPYQTLTGHKYPPGILVFSPDGRTLASSVLDEIRLWNVTTGKHLKTITVHTYSVIGLAFSLDSSTFVSAGRDGTVILWDLAELRGN